MLNKSDLADRNIVKEWQEKYQTQGLSSLAISVKNRHNLERLKGETVALAKAGKTRDKPARLMIVGVPNCGKSSLINALARQKKTKIADSPGVTREVSLYKLGNLDLIDSPGTLWPNLTYQMAAARLAALCSIKDDVYLTTEALGLLYPYLCSEYSNGLGQRYQYHVCKDYVQFLTLVAARFGRNIQDMEALAMIVF